MFIHGVGFDLFILYLLLVLKTSEVCLKTLKFINT